MTKYIPPHLQGGDPQEKLQAEFEAMNKSVVSKTSNRKTACPACGREFQFPESLNGKEVKCPVCSSVFAVRNPDSPPPQYATLATRSAQPANPTMTSPRSSAAVKARIRARKRSQNEKKNAKVVVVTITLFLGFFSLCLILAVASLSEPNAFPKKATGQRQPAEQYSHNNYLDGPRNGYYSLRDYNLIRTGQSEYTVTSTVGRPSFSSFEASLEFVEVKNLHWKNDDGTNFWVTIQDGVVVAKGQIGLR